MAIDDAVLVPPIAAEEIAQNAALIDRGAIRIVQPVEGGDAGERRRLLDRHPPLRHAEIRLPDAADLAVRPFLMAEPFDDVVKVFLLVLVEQAEFAARLAAAANVHMGVDVAAPDIQFDRPGLAPEKLRRRRQRVVVVAVRRRRQHDRERPLARRHVERHRDLDAVMNADFDFARLQLVCHRFPRYVIPITQTAKQSIGRDCAASNVSEVEEARSSSARAIAGAESSGALGGVRA